MKVLTLFAFLLMSLSTLATTGAEVFIRGKISNDFNDKQVKVIDSLGQTYYLPRTVFPRDFQFKQGETFAIEVPEIDLTDVKVIKK